MAAFDWGGYLTLATSLAEQADEASRRSAVSRAYYYVYNLASARAYLNGFRPARGRGFHEQLWALYEDVPVLECKELSIAGDRMKRRRRKADYEAVYLRLEEEAAEMLVDARAFAEKLARVEARHPNPAGQRQ
jgi:uncharacterized protein (UPF0332 family)